MWALLESGSNKPIIKIHFSDDEIDTIPAELRRQLVFQIIGKNWTRNKILGITVNLMGCGTYLLGIHTLVSKMIGCLGLALKYWGQNGVVAANEISNQSIELMVIEVEQCNVYMRVPSTILFACLNFHDIAFKKIQWKLCSTPKSDINQSLSFLMFNFKH